MFARSFASFTHASINQYYGDKPYVSHLDDVYNIIQKYSYNQCDFVNFDELLKDTAYLHDIIEDTNETKENLSEIFHYHVVKATQLCSDIQADTRKERKKLTNKVFSALSPEKLADRITLIVKPADRLANMSRAFETNNVKKMKMYLKEYDDFKNSIYRKGVCDSIWNELDRLIEEISLK